jgi:hypothetical protein
VSKRPKALALLALPSPIADRLAAHFTCRKDRLMKRFASLLLLALPLLTFTAASASADSTVVAFWPLFYHENQVEEQKSDTGVLDLGLARVFTHERDQDETEMQVGGVLFAKLFGIETDEDESQVEVLDLGIAKLLEVENHATAGHHTKFLDVPLITVFDSRNETDERHTRVLDVPLITLFESKGDTTDPEARVSENKLLTLPFIGSLFRNRTEGDKKELELFYFIEMKNY